jgi:hypothetical protein
MAPNQKEFARFREDVIRHERLLVTNISLAVDHPYHYLVSLAKAVDRTLLPAVCVCRVSCVCVSCVVCVCVRVIV